MRSTTSRLVAPQAPPLSQLPKCDKEPYTAAPATLTKPAVDNKSTSMARDENSAGVDDSSTACVTTVPTPASTAVAAPVQRSPEKVDRDIDASKRGLNTAAQAFVPRTSPVEVTCSETAGPSAASAPATTAAPAHRSAATPGASLNHFAAEFTPATATSKPTGSGHVTATPSAAAPLPCSTNPAPLAAERPKTNCNVKVSEFVPVGTAAKNLLPSIPG